MKKIFTLLFVAGLFSSCGSGTSSSSASDTTAVDTSKETTDATGSKKETENATKWDYSEDVDKMTSKKKYYAVIKSENELKFEFPYDGGSKGIITIRNDGKENEAILSISKGQFNTGVDGTTIIVRFDDEKAINFDCGQSSDGSSDVLFIRNSKKFISKLKNSKEVKIQAEFYEAGNEVMEFKTAGFTWAH